MTPSSPAEARRLLVELGAPDRLLRHVELVGEAGDMLLTALARIGVSIDSNFVRIGIVVHDAGKIVHPAELDQAGGEHEPAGEAMLLRHGVEPAVARVCLSHARWDRMDVSFEEVVIALADKLWKGVRNVALEERMADCAAAAVGKSRWDLFVELDTLFEEIAADGSSRLERSRPGRAG
jgi:hypothetical protein